MIHVEYIIDNGKSLLTIMFDNFVMKHLRVKCDDYLNFFQATHKLSHITLFKADTGYRVVRVPRIKKTYQINVRHPLEGFKEFEAKPCTCYLKKNRSILIKINVE